MSETDKVIDGLNLFGDTPQEPDQPDAAETAATPDATDDEGEAISLDEALAGLDGEAAPDQTASPGTEPLDATAPEATPEVAELLRQLDAYKAREAIEQAAQADAAFDERWVGQQQINDRFYDAEAQRIQALGESEGRTQDEIDAAIYRRVELGNGFGIERWNAQTRQMETVGRIQADRELSDNYSAAVRAYERSKTQPSRFDQLVTHYQLDATDRTALAKFINYPPEHLEEIAKTLGAKNQRVTGTFQQVRDTAVANVRARLSNQTAPGTPGAPAPKKPYVFTHRNDVKQDETRLVAGMLGLTRPSQ